MANHHAHPKSRWTFLLVSDKGQSKKLPHFKGWAVFVLWLVLALMGAVAGLGVWLNISWKAQQSLSQTLRNREIEIKQLTDSNEQLLSKLLAAENRLAQRKPPAANESQDADASAAGPSRTHSQSETTKSGAETVSGDTASQVVIEGFEIAHRSKSKQFIVSYRIRNNGSREKPVIGHSFIIFKHFSTDSDQWISLPAVALENGYPVDYRQGAYFSAVNYKDFRLTIEDRLIPPRFNRAAFLVYDSDGGLMLEKQVSFGLPQKSKDTDPKTARLSSGSQATAPPGKDVQPKPHSDSPPASSQAQKKTTIPILDSVRVEPDPKGRLPETAQTAGASVWPESHPYSIHLYSYNDQRQARERVHILRTKGYDCFVMPVRIPGKGRYYRIFLGHYKSLQAAEEYLNEIRGRRDFEKDIHIMSRRQAMGG